MGCSAFAQGEPGVQLQWEHDVDIYMPARDAFALIRHLRRDCSDGRYHRRSRWCRRTLHFRGLVDRNGASCCGFGFKLFHRKSDACELDVLVLSASDAPYMHGETPLWPLWGPLLARPWHWLSAAWLRVWRMPVCGRVYRENMCVPCARCRGCPVSRV